ncbi:activator of HSP90 ATPase [Rugosimonospora africana]|uniref:Activator of HSP90 ATPase n=2 Tax=Rugosimonospora africana TaxID=556532 RepID=A0A8J3VTX6_9ACTN|nr:activator of HSP90 ATPase [Rugosimonospora africana]
MQINAVRRQVKARTLEAGEARVVAVSQTFDAPIDDVWDACTNAERIPRWFLPVSGELRLGGKYQLEGNAGGTVEQCDPPNAFSATWEFGGEVSWIEVWLAADPEGGTRLNVEHIAHVDQVRWAEFGPGAVGIGWDMILMGLAGYLSTAGLSIDPKEALAWQLSEEGRRFSAESSERWRVASVAAGTDPAEAQGAADRVFAAYTGGAPDPDQQTPAQETPDQAAADQ